MILNLLKDQGCSSYVIKHSQAVEIKAIKLAQNFDSDVDLELIKKGAILHDIGRSITQNIDHGLVGAQILQKIGCEEKLIRIAERHIGAGITAAEAESLGLPPRDFIPISWEEKIVAHADNLIHGFEEVELSFVIAKWTKSLGPDHPSIKRLVKLHMEVIG